MKTRNEVIEECVELVESLIRPECLDHTPYRGTCVSCGSIFNDDILPEPDIVIKKLKELKE